MANNTPQKKLDSLPDLIVKKRGNVSAIARVLKQPRSTVHKHITESEELSILLADERERMLDNAEDKLGGAVDKGEAWAVCFTLKTQGQKRGYIEKQQHEVTGKDGADLIPRQYIVEVVEKPKSV